MRQQSPNGMFCVFGGLPDPRTGTEQDRTRDQIDPMRDLPIVSDRSTRRTV